MRVIIVGAGEIGSRLAESLIRRPEHQVTLVEIDKERAEELASRLDALVLHGDGTHPEILKKAGIDKADALVATTGSDAINTVVAMLGQRFGIERKVVRLEEVGLRAACQEIGVSRIVAPTLSAAAEMLSALSGFQRLDFSLMAEGGLELAQLPATHAAGRKLSEVELPPGALAVAVVRGEGEVLFPHPGTRLEEQDDLLVLLESGALLPRAKKALGGDG